MMNIVIIIYDDLTISLKMIIYDDLTILLWWNIIKNKSYKVPQKVSPLRMNLPHGVPTAVAITGTSISFTHHLHTKIQSCLRWLSRTNKKTNPKYFSRSRLVRSGVTSSENIILILGKMFGEKQCALRKEKQVLPLDNFYSTRAGPQSNKQK